MPFQITKMDNLPLGLFRPTNTLPPGAANFNDRTGQAITSMTYHHIISKEKLRLFFDAVSSAGDMNTAEFNNICRQVISKHYTRKASPTSDGYPSAVAFQDNGGNDIGQQAVWECVQGVLRGAKATRTAANTDSNGIWQLFENFYFWWPANLHHGPRARLDPNSPGFLADMDDGGDSFEQAASRALPAEHFSRLQTAERLMSDYIAAAANAAKKQTHRRALLKSLFDDSLQKLLASDKYKEPNVFDNRVWKPELKNGQLVYRLKT